MTLVDSFCNVLRRELRSVVRQPVYWMILVVLPVVSCLLFGVMFSRGVARDIPIAVVDGDHTPLSRQLTDMISATPAALVRYEIASTDEGERMIRRGEISAFVVIPSGFATDIAASRKAPVELFVSGANVTVNGLISRDIQTVVQTFGVGVGIRRMVAHGASRDEAMATVMPIRFDEHILFNPWLNYGCYLAPSFSVMMLIVFIVCSTTWAVGSELRYRRAGEWIAAAGGNIGVALAGKLLPSLLSMVASSLAMFAILTHIVGVPVNGSFGLLLLATLFFIVSYQMIAVAVVAVTANMRLALSLSGGYAVLAFTFSGLTFPIMAMWEPMQWMSRLFPFTYYSEVMVDQMMRGAPVRYSLVNVAILALFALVPLVALPRLKRVCSDSRFWGRS